MITDTQLNEILSKLFDAVGRKFVSIPKSCRGKKWFLQSTWTQEQEDKFKAWLTKYLVRKEKISPELAGKKAKMFCFQYGWKYKEM